MSDNNSLLKRLFQSYLNNTLEGEERNEFFRLVSDRLNEKEILVLLTEELDNPEIPDFPLPTDQEALYSRIMAEAERRKNENRFKRSFLYGNRAWLAAAAGFFIPVAFAAYLLFFSDLRAVDESLKVTSDYSGINVPPGGNKAVLTLEDGDQIILDTVSNGIITRQASAQIIKSAGGHIEYHADNDASEKMVYNTVSTPVGGQYQLTLSDGTRVWLNAASSVRFPATFYGKERKVFITGEAYFEVNPQYSQTYFKKGRQKKVPFLVDVAGKGEIEVLGTHFNINSYINEEAVRTTLLEGSIKFTPLLNQNIQNGNAGNDRHSFLMAAGQQLMLDPNGQVQINNDVNLEKVVAWKNGYFLFSSSTLQEIMNQIARWYDIEVVLEEDASDERFSGKIQLDLNLSEVLKILEKNELTFRMEGRKLYVGS